MNLENQNDNFDFNFSSEGVGVNSLDHYLDKDDVIDDVVKDDINDINKHLDLDTDPPKDTLDDIIDNGGAGGDSDDVIIDNNKDDDKDDIKLGLDDLNDDSNINVDYKTTLQYLIDNKIIDDIDGLEDEEGNIIPLADMDVDAEVFAEIIRQKQEQLKEDLLKDKISTSGVSDFTRSLIEIEKNGGNVSQAIESYEKYKNPLESLDLSVEADQQAAIYLKLKASNIPDTDIVDLIKSYKANGELEDKAVKAKEDLELAFSKQLEDLNTQALERKSAQKEMLKQYRTSLDENLKPFQLTDTYKKKMLDIATKEDDKGKFELDRIYAETRQNPKEAAELVLFLTNKAEYIKQITENVKRENTLSNFKTIKIVPKGKSNLKIEGGGLNKDSDKNFIDISKI